MKKIFKIVVAGGGLVKNQHNEYLLIYRRGHWDLPKGKKEADETIEKTAVREVAEETGLKNPVIIKKLPTTYHFYKENGTLILKKCRWFEMYCEQSDLQPQTEEDIEQVVWLNKTAIIEIYEKMYPSIKKLFMLYFK